jgi:hypothetical protein
MRALVLVAVLLVAGCGGSDDGATSAARVYFLRDGKVWPVAREVPTGEAVTSLVDALREGPTDEEAGLGFTTAVPAGDDETPSREALAQLVYTLTGFTGADSAEVDGDTYTRSDFEEQTPSVLVESPLPYAEVTSPLNATGTANTFEATFNYELLDADGKVVDENFVTATSGTGTRGTFDFTTGEFDDVAALKVFEVSAEDGSRIREVEIPLRTSQ